MIQFNFQQGLAFNTAWVKVVDKQLLMTDLIATLAQYFSSGVGLRGAAHSQTYLFFTEVLLLHKCMISKFSPSNTTMVYIIKILIP